jgi:hypothetical protein
MANTTTIKHGAVSVSIPNNLAPPTKAGKMSPEEVRVIPKPPLGIGLVCDQTATAMGKAADKFMAPAGVTPEKLRTVGTRAEEIDDIIRDVEVILETIKQANLLFDAEAWDVLRSVNDQLKAQAKRNPELLKIFDSLVSFLAKGPRAPKTPKSGNGGGGGGSK